MSPEEEARLIAIFCEHEDAEDAKAELCVVRFRDALLIGDEILDDDDLDELVRVIRQESNRVGDILQDHRSAR